MSLRTKILLSICVVNVVVLLLLMLNVWVESVANAKQERHRDIRLVSRLISDWIEGDEILRRELEQGKDARLFERLDRSGLITDWVVVRCLEGELSLLSASGGYGETNLRRDVESFRDVLKVRETLVTDRHVFARLTPFSGGDGYAARFGIWTEEALPWGVSFGESLQRLLWIFGLGTALLLTVTLVLIHRLVLRPLDSLFSASERVARGEFGISVPILPGYDEMARMTSAFNLMMARIAASRQGMQEEIEGVRSRIRDTEKRLFAAQRLSTTGTLAAGIAHEINNPLGGMINALRGIREGRLEGEKREEYLALIEEGLLRIREIVDQILRFSPRSIDPVAFGYRDVMDRALAFLEHRIRRRGVVVENRISPDLPEGWGDPLEIQQAFLNVLINAVEAVPHDAGRIGLEGRAQSDGTVRIRFEDNGCGMDAEGLQRCFDPFYTTREAGQGTGLGLSVAHNIVTNQGGEIRIESEPGKGTRVEMHFRGTLSGEKKE